MSDTNADTIYRYDDAGYRSVFATEAAGSQPRGIAMDSASNLYVANFGAGYSDIVKFSSTGANLGVFASSMLITPETMVFDSAGNMYVADISRGAIVKFSSSGAYLGSIVTGLSRAVGLAINTSGTLYLSNGSVIEKYSTNGNDLGTFATVTGLLNGISFDSAGNLYAANSTADVINEFTSTGVNFGNITTGESLAYDVLINGSGNLDLISYSSHSVHTFSVGGASLGVLDSSLIGPTFGYYPQVVPEPSSLLMVGAGLAIVLFRCRSARRSIRVA